MASDGTVAARHLLAQFGMQARNADELIGLPPEGGTLVLSAPYWDLMQGSAERLLAWVERGGHLVVDAGALNSASFRRMLPMRSIATPARAGRLPLTQDCRVLHPHAALAPQWGDPRGYVLCANGWSHLVSELPPLWALGSDEHGDEVLRVPLGRGRVTAFAGVFGFDQQDRSNNADAHLRNFSNRGLLEGDNAALFAALVDVQRGRDAWFVTHVQRPPLPVWLWQHAAPALLLGALALAFALWRAGSRLGPLQADPPPARRSLSAQIRGLADFLFTHHPATLHAAALRALDEAAARRIPGWARLAAADQAQALARLSGLPEARLAAAREPKLQRNASAWSDTLALLESARRTLHDPRRTAR
jgi:hypothetical protein